MNRKSFLVAGLLCGMAATALADEPAFTFSREIKSPAIKQDELLSVVLDSELYAATRDGFPDLRVMNEKGNTTPFVIRKLQTTGSRTSRQTWTARNVSIKPRETGSLEITVELGEKDPPPNGLTLVTPLRDFEQRVGVETSADGQKWESTGSETVIFDYSRYMDVRKESVAFPETSRKHFRIIIDKPTVEQESELLDLTRRLQGKSETERTEKLIIDRRPFRIEQIDFWRETAEARATGDEKSKYLVSAPKVEQISDKRQTVVYVDSQRQPLTALELETSDRNFSRHAVVEIEQWPGPKNTWRKIGEETITRIDFKTLQRRELSISFPETRSLRYRLVIDNKDSPPLAVTGVKAEGDVYELLVLGTPDRKYQLVYGSEDTKPATYDTAAIQELLKAGFQPTRATLGPASVAANSAVTPDFRWSKLLNNPRLLISVISVLVAILGYGLYHAVKRIDKIPNDNQK